MRRRRRRPSGSSCQRRASSLPAPCQPLARQEANRTASRVIMTSRAKLEAQGGRPHRTSIGICCLIVCNLRLAAVNTARTSRGAHDDDDDDGRDKVQSGDDLPDAYVICNSKPHRLLLSLTETDSLFASHQIGSSPGPDEKGDLVGAQRVSRGSKYYKHTAFTWWRNERPHSDLAKL